MLTAVNEPINRLFGPFFAEKNGLRGDDGQLQPRDAAERLLAMDHQRRLIEPRGDIAQVLIVIVSFQNMHSYSDEWVSVSRDTDCG